MEIVEKLTWPVRVVVTVQDKDGKRMLVAFYFDNMAQFDCENVKVGSTIAVLYAEQHYFVDGNIGLRVEHPQFVKMFTCGLNTLLRISDDIESETPDNCAQKCKACGKEDEADTIILQRCSRCLGASYCGKECQMNAWNSGHKRECKVFQAVIALQRSRSWGRSISPAPLKWIGFGERDPDLKERDGRPVDNGDKFDPAWNNTKPAVVQKLQKSFIITSGEMIWGQLASLLEGMMTSVHDAPTPGVDKVLLPSSGTVAQQGYTFRAAARVGEWKIAKVNGYGHADREFDSYLVYHSSQSPLDLLCLARGVTWETRLETPRVCWVNRYDLGYHCANDFRAARLWGEVDPGAGWLAALERYKRLSAVNKSPNEGHPDKEKWKRLHGYASHNIFLVDAADGAEVVKLMARPSELEENLRAEQSSSFVASGGGEDAFGCNLKFLGEEWEFARLIFSEEDSTVFPGEKELVGFWYDQDNRYNAVIELKAKSSNATAALLTVRLNVSSISQAASDAAVNVQTKIQNMATGPIGDSSGYTVDVLSEQSKLLESLETVLARIDVLVKIGDKLAKIHPYANLAWQTITAVYKAVQMQQETDEKLTGLAATILDVYSFAKDIDSLPNKMDGLEDVVTKILNQTVECGLYIQEYTTSGFYYRLWNQLLSPEGQRVEAFISILNTLKGALDTRVTIQTAFVSANTFDAVQILVNSDRLKILEPIKMDGGSREACLAGTREETITFITNWLMTPPNDGNILWLNGVAGAGKSTARGIPVFQQECANDHVAPEVSAAIGHDPGVITSRIEEQFKTLLLDPLTSSRSQMQGPTIVVIDALDECGDLQERTKLVSLLATEFPKLPAMFRFLITSRPDSDIADAFNNQPAIRSYPLDIASQSNIADIRCYIEHRMADIRRRGAKHNLGSSDGTARIWDAETQKQIGAALKSDAQWVFCVGFSSDGTRIVAGSGDGKVRIWDAEARTQIGQALEGHKDTVHSVSFSSDGKQIVSGSRDCTARIWDTESQTQIGSLGQESWIIWVGFSPDGTRILSGSGAGIWIWDVETQKQIGALDNEEPVNSVGLSPDGTRIVSGSSNGTVRIWDAEAQTQIGPALKGHEYSVTSVVFSSDGTRIVSGSNDHTVRIWDVETKKQIGAFDHEEPVRSVGLSPDGTRIVSASLDFTVRIWGAETLVENEAGSEGHGQCVTSVCFSFDGKRIVSGSDDHSVRIWDAETQKQIGALDHEEPVNSVGLSPDGTRIVSGSSDGAVRIWDAEAQKQIGALEGHEDSVAFVSFSSDGKRIVSGSDDHSVRIWDAETLKQIGVLDDHEEPVNSVGLSPDGTRIVSSDGTVRIWDAETQKQIGVLEGHEDSVASVSFSPDGKRIVSGSYDRTVRIWDAETQTQIGEALEGHEGAVTSVCFSSDGKRIISGSDDCTVRIWDVEAQRQIGAALDGHQESTIAQYRSGILEDHNGFKKGKMMMKLPYCIPAQPTFHHQSKSAEMAGLGAVVASSVSGFPHPCSLASRSIDSLVSSLPTRH
ncbi:hypothetical protein B0H14DRAFT_3500386 [Mycena olivaceomarginata]|nr:hypothetical protein B0H14DRAFT_3500386 [Mycena olivaceomarginata]